MGVFSSRKGIGVRRTSYPSGPWVDANGNPARSPNDTSTPTPERPAAKDLMTKESKNGNPDPFNWKFVKVEERGKYLILMMEYPDCTNYEGKKILVFENATLIELVNQKMIDPHFFPGNTKYKSPIARFEPTDRGWKMALMFVSTLMSPFSQRQKTKDNCLSKTKMREILSRAVPAIENSLFLPRTTS